MKQENNKWFIVNRVISILMEERENWFNAIQGETDPLEIRYYDGMIDCIDEILTYLVCRGVDK